VLTHGPRQAHVWLIFDVRQNFGMRSVDRDFFDNAADVLRACEKPSTRGSEGFRVSVMRFAMRSVLAIGVRARKLPMKRFQQPSAEPLACSVRRAMPTGLEVFGWHLSGCTSALTHSLPSRSATSSARRSVSRRVFQMFQCAHTPNQALQPTRMLVTFCAYAQPAPSTRVADL